MPRFSLVALALVSATACYADSITSPQKQFGHIIGADYVLPNYTEFSTYWKKLAKESSRMKLTSIGKTEEGRDQLMAIISSPGNLRRAEHYRLIAKQLASGKGLTEEQAQKLAKEGKAIVWIDGGLHASEVLGAQQLIETVYQLLSRNDAETKRILNDCIILATHANPDGMELVSNWYMREKEPTKRSTAGLPRLYQKYIGHDNNRDFYAATQSETKNMARIMYREWFPQIVYNHHQTGPSGAVLYCPPFRDPYNHNVDPMSMVGTDIVGNAIHERLILENKPGAVREDGAPYSTWFNGSLRTTGYFHNMVGILTETIGNPTPTKIPLVPERQLMSGNLLFPIAPQEWHFRQSVDYSVSANYAVLDIASRRKDEFLMNIYRMANNSVKKGSRDSFTVRPKWIEGGADELEKKMKDPANLDPRGYILSAEQKDFPTAIKLANALIANGVTVDRATKPFTVGTKNYPVGSLVVRCDQAFRPHILDMFEPQDHPNDIPAPGANPKPPYDSAGYTMALQMGVAFDRILTAFEAPTEPIPDTTKPPLGTVTGDASLPELLLSPEQNDAFTVVQTALTTGAKAAKDAIGNFHVAATPEVLKAVGDLGVRAVRTAPTNANILKPVRVALWDRYGGSMESGWIRWLLEQQKIPFTVVFPPTLDAGDLKSKYDVIIFPDGSIPATRTATRTSTARANATDRVPEEYKGQVGSVTIDKTVPQLKEFLEAGGSIVTIGSATNLAVALKLPVADALVGEDGKRLPRSKYYVPGSLLEASVNTSIPVAAGMPEKAIFQFDNSPVFKFKPEAAAAGLKKLAWFPTDAPLRSGWAWGQSVLKDGITAFVAPVGKGELYAFGPDIIFRAQSHGTFRLLFNAIYSVR